MKRLIALAMCIALALGASWSRTASAVAPPQTQLVSLNRDGTDSGNGYSAYPELSADGQVVAFTSAASDLVVANDTNGAYYDVFVRDLRTGATSLASINRDGTGSGNSSSETPELSADGQVVAFRSTASDLVANDTNGDWDVFVRDLRTGTTSLVSINRDGTASGNGYSYYPALSADGQVVAFASWASDLVANDTNGSADVFVRDLRTGTTSLVSINRDGTASGNGYSFSYRAALSADGQVVAFASLASDLVVANDTNGAYYDVFVRDLRAGATSLVSINRDGTRSGNGYSYYPALSADGQVVAFRSTASDLVANDTNGNYNVFVRDLRAGATSLVSINRDGTRSGNGLSDGPALSADGQVVTFQSTASDLVANDTNGDFDVFVRDLRTGTTSLVSINRDGTGSGNGYSGQGMLSADGQVVAFTSTASDLMVANDTTGNYDVFVRDLRAGATSLVSLNQDGTASGNSASYNPVLSADGQVVAFVSYASDLVANDTNGQWDVFVREVSFNQPPTVAAGGPYNVDEGASINITASGSDPDGGPLSYAWDLDNDGTFETPDQSATFSAATLDGPSSITIAVQVIDSGGLSATDQAIVTILNVAPTASFSTSSDTLYQGQSATLAFSEQADPSAADSAAGFGYAYDCTGDGTFEIVDSFEESAVCSYPDAGAFTARGRITDNDGGSSDYMVAITVLTPRQGTEGLIQKVRELVGGVLNEGQGNALIAKLEAAIQQLDRGNVNTALNQLEAFVSQVSGLMNAGVLPPAEGQPLIDAANAIIAALQGAS